MTDTDMSIRIKALAEAGGAISAAGLAIFLICFSAEAAAGDDPNAPQRGNDLQYTMTIEFKEAVFGKETEITIPRTETCDTCTGSEQSQERSRKLVPFVKAQDSRKLYRIRRLAAWSTAVHVRTAAVRAKSLKRNVGTCHGAGKVKTSTQN